MPSTRADRAECTAGDATSYLLPCLSNKHCSPHLKPALLLLLLSLNIQPENSFVQESVTAPSLARLALAQLASSRALLHSKCPFFCVWGGGGRSLVPSAAPGCSDFYLPMHESNHKLLGRRQCLNDRYERWIRCVMTGFALLSQPN